MKALRLQFSTLDAHLLLFSSFLGVSSVQRGSLVDCPSITQLSTFWPSVQFFPFRFGCGLEGFVPSRFNLLSISIWANLLLLLLRLQNPRSWVRNINFIVLLNGPTSIPAATGINYASFVLVGFIFRELDLPSFSLLEERHSRSSSSFRIRHPSKKLRLVVQSSSNTSHAPDATSRLTSSSPSFFYSTATSFRPLSTRELS